jgi:hypothetical protein
MERMQHPYDTIIGAQVRKNQTLVNDKIYDSVGGFTQVLYATNTGLHGIPDEE